MQFTPSDFQRARAELDALEAAYLTKCTQAPCQDTDPMLAAAWRFLQQAKRGLQEDIASD